MQYFGWAFETFPSEENIKKIFTFLYNYTSCLADYTGCIPTFILLLNFSSVNPTFLEV